MEVIRWTNIERLFAQTTGGGTGSNIKQ